MFKKISVIIFLFVFLFLPHQLYSVECEPGFKYNSQDELSQIIALCEQKKAGLSQKATTLAAQINYINTQILLTSLKIQETEEIIKKTQTEIELLTAKIEGLDNSLNYLTKLLLYRVVNGYKKRSISFLNIILDSDNAFDLFNRIKYLKSTQESNQKTLIQVQTTKLNFEEQKKLREEKKKQLNDLEQKLIVQKNDLNSQTREKQILLGETQNDERKYQELLNQALAEFGAIQNAFASGVKVGPVKKGDPIAILGNTGYPYCSTGPHLHFEVRINNNWVNTENYLSPKTVKDDQNNGSSTIGSGNWDWPLTDPIEVTQRYGSTPWSWRYTYSGGVHTGVDMVSDSSQIIRAPADGTLYS